MQKHHIYKICSNVIAEVAFVYSEIFRNIILGFQFLKYFFNFGNYATYKMHLSAGYQCEVQ